MRVLLLPEAERDLEIGADFYESQKAGLGVYFNFLRGKRRTAVHLPAIPACGYLGGRRRS